MERVAEGIVVEKADQGLRGIHGDPLHDRQQAYPQPPRAATADLCFSADMALKQNA